MIAFHEEQARPTSRSPCMRGADGRGAPLRHDGHRRATAASSSSTRSRPSRRSNLISMGIYVFDRDILIQRLEEDAKMRRLGATTSAATSSRAWSRWIASSPTHSSGYWRDVGTIASLLGVEHGAAQRAARLRPVRHRLGHPHPQRGAPAGQGRPSARRSRRSLISHGCIVDGTVEHSRPVAGRVRGRRRRRARLDHHDRLASSGGTPSWTARSSTRRWWSGPAR